MYGRTWIHNRHYHKRAIEYVHLAVSARCVQKSSYNSREIQSDSHFGGKRRVLVGYFFLSCSASEQLHGSLASYAKVDRAHPHTRIYKRSFGASLYVSACSICFLHCDADEQFNCHEGRVPLLRSRHNTCPRRGRVTTRGPFLRFDDLRRR